MKAMLLAAGLGKRLRPITYRLPKPLLPIFDRPVIAYNLDLVKRSALEEVIINLHHIPEKIMEYVGDGSRWGLKVRYSHEPSIRGTAGALKQAESWLGGAPFVLINSDTVREIELDPVVEFHTRKGSLATLVLQVNPALPPGQGLEVDSEGRILRLTARFQRRGESGIKADFTGIHILDNSILGAIPPDTFYEINDHLYPRLLAKGEPIMGYLYNGYWKDIGTFEDYCGVHLEALQGKSGLASALPEVSPGVYMGAKVKLQKDVRLIPPVWINDEVLAGAAAIIGPYAVVGRGCKIRSKAGVSRAIVWKYTEIAEGQEAVGGIFARGFGKVPAGAPLKDQRKQRGEH